MSIVLRGLRSTKLISQGFFNLLDGSFVFITRMKAERVTELYPDWDGGL
jgi:hypothetical protein